MVWSDYFSKQNIIEKRQTMIFRRSLLSIPSNLHLVECKQHKL